MPGDYMLVYFSLVSRLAPLLLMLSVVLAGTRWLHDHPQLAARRLNEVAAGVFMLAGLAFVVPYAVRMGLILGIHSAMDGQDFELAAARIEQYRWWGGRLDGNLVLARGVANAHEGHLAEAVPDLLAAARSHDPLVSKTSATFQAALCLYALHRNDEAWKLFIALPESIREAPIRDYCLGRLLERRGDRQAGDWFARSLARDPRFTPSLYRLLRLASLSHDVAGAELLVTTFRRLNPAEAHAQYLDDILNAIRRGETLADYDPYELAH